MNKIFLRTTLIYSLIHFAPFARAQNCPDLRGEYVCGYASTHPYLVTVNESSTGSYVSYEFNSVSEGQRQIVTDGRESKLESSFGKGTYSARCEGGQLLVQFQVKKADGRIFRVEDTIRVERKALVRIRLSLPGSQVKVKNVYVCRPYYPPKK